ncbi:MAG: glycosyltransferase [Planctomycetota bacterium]
MSDSVHVAMIADRRAVLPLAVAMSGVTRGLTARTAHFHILGVGLTAADREQLERLVDPHRVSWLEPAEAERLIAELPQIAHIPPISFTRLLLPALLPELDRVVYLDADMVVKADFGELWDQGTAGRSIAAVADPGMPTLAGAECMPYARELVQDPEAQPFNAGMMLMDLRACRERGVADRALRFIRENLERLSYADQDGLNFALEGDWHALEMKWNVPITLVNGPEPKDLPEVAAFNTKPAFSVPAVYHLFGGHKPWNSGPRHTLREAWLEELRVAGVISEQDWPAWRRRDDRRARSFSIRKRLNRWVRL